MGGLRYFIGKYLSVFDASQHKAASFQNHLFDFSLRCKYLREIGNLSVKNNGLRFVYSQSYMQNL